MRTIIIKRHYSETIFLLFFCFFLLQACEGEKKDSVDTPFDAELVPSMDTDSVTELISDSGLIRYKMITAKWQVFDNARDPYWFFPKKIYIEQFDTLFDIQATLKADTAWNYTQRKLWKLKGNVFIRNRKDETFESEELFWDEKTGKVYSNKYIEINKPGELLLQGRGFESNQQMTIYRVFHPFNSEFFISEDAALPEDSIK